MGRYAQFVVGPAGSGKSTYCFTMQNAMASEGSHRLRGLVVNLDPGQERTEEQEKQYPFDLDVRELISVSDVLEELDFGPNGALVFCMEHLVENMEWLKDGLDEIGGSDDEYFIFDCPGQIELYTHIPVLRTIVEKLQSWNITVCVVHVIDALFIDDSTKFISGALLALTSMMQLQAPAINVISKCDIKSATFGGGRKRDPYRNLVGGGLDPNNVTLDSLQRAEHEFDQQQQADQQAIGNEDSEFLNVDDPEYFNPDSLTLKESIFNSNAHPKFKRLSTKICDLLDNYSLVNFLPLNITDEESITAVLLQTDMAVQYGEDLEPRDVNFDDSDRVEDGTLFS